MSSSASRSRRRSVIGFSTAMSLPGPSPGPSPNSPSDRVGTSSGAKTASADGRDADRGRAGADGRGLAVEPAALALEAATPAGHGLAVLEVEHRQEAGRGQREGPPRDTAAEHADRDAVDRQQRESRPAAPGAGCTRAGRPGPCRTSRRGPAAGRSRPRAGTGARYCCAPVTAVASACSSSVSPCRPGAGSPVTSVVTATRPSTSWASSTSAPGACSRRSPAPTSATSSASSSSGAR